MTRGLSRVAVALPVLAAVALVVATTPALDTHSETVLLGAALLLSLGAAAAVDEPDGRWLDASPTTFAQRVLRRAAVVAVLVVPVGVLLAVWTVAAGGSVDGEVLRSGVVMLLCAVAVAAALRRWGGLVEPAVVTGVVLVVGLVVARHVLAALPGQPLDTDDSQTLAVVVASVVLVAALRDPATAATRVALRR